MKTLIDQYREASELIYPGLGEWTYDCFTEYNEYFDNQIPPMPIQWHWTLPYGSAIALAYGHKLIALGIYVNKKYLVQKNSEGYFIGNDRAKHVILHEMIHTFLSLRKENTKHSGKPWCREIMRLSEEIFKTKIYSSPTTVRKVFTGKSENGVCIKESIRFNPKNKKTGELSLTQKAISSWPSCLFKYDKNGMILKHTQPPCCIPPNINGND